MMFHISYKSLTSKEFNSHLVYITQKKYRIYYYSYEDAVDYDMLDDYYFSAYISVKYITITLTYKKNNKWINVAHNLSFSDKKEDLTEITDPKTAYSTMQRYCHFPDLKYKYGYSECEGKISWDILNIGALRYFNKEKEGKRYNNCIGYDMNSAFLNACIDLEIPDTEKVPKTKCRVKEGEIGFRWDGIPVFYPSLITCEYVFPVTINKDLTRWAKTIYRRKKDAKSKNEKQHQKDMGNFAIGCLARHNPFIRNCIIDKSNKNMLKLIDNNTLLCNTDSIVSLVERPELKISDNLGDFKVEETGDFALSYNGYQWNNNFPKINGFVKEKTIMFKDIVGRGYDILTDVGLDDTFIPRYFDIDKMRIRKRDIEEELKEAIREVYSCSERQEH